MSKSFDDSIKKHLAGYEMPPPPALKAAVLGKPGFDYTVGYRLAGAAFLLLSFWMIGRNDLPKNLADMAASHDDNIHQMVDLRHMPMAFDEDCWPENSASGVTEVAVLEEPVIAAVEEDKPDDQFSGIGREPESIFTQLRKKYFLAEIDNEVDASTLSPKQRSMHKIVPQKEPFFRLYVDAGAFFVYNKLQPDLNDELYVDNYEAPFGVAPTRIGALVHGGLAHDWNSMMTSRLGLLINNYNQHFSFTIRDFEPDSVVSSEGFLVPVYTETPVNVRKRVTSVGLRVQQIWNFPSEYNSLYLAAEYQRTMGTGAQFVYEGQTYDLLSRNQYFAEFGLRKILFENTRGQFYVIPSMRYSLTTSKGASVMQVKPFSVGVSVSYGLK